MGPVFVDGFCSFDATPHVNNLRVLKVRYMEDVTIYEYLQDFRSC